MDLQLFSKSMKILGHYIDKPCSRDNEFETLSNGNVIVCLDRAPSGNDKDKLKDMGLIQLNSLCWKTNFTG